MAEFSRREVNRALLASALALVGRPGSAIAPVSVAPPRPLFNFAIAGGYHHNLQKALPSLKCGMELTLQREADNPHDSNAIAVHGPDGTRLGYIPREANTPVAALLDAGHVIQAEIISMLDIRYARDIPDDLVFTGFETGDPMVKLSVL